MSVHITYLLNIIDYPKYKLDDTSSQKCYPWKLKFKNTLIAVDTQEQADHFMEADKFSAKTPHASKLLYSISRLLPCQPGSGRLWSLMAALAPWQFFCVVNFLQ